VLHSTTLPGVHGRSARPCEASCTLNITTKQWASSHRARPFRQGWEQGWVVPQRSSRPERLRGGWAPRHGGCARLARAGHDVTLSRDDRMADCWYGFRFQIRNADRASNRCRRRRDDTTGVFIGKDGDYGVTNLSPKHHAGSAAEAFDAVICRRRGTPRDLPVPGRE